MSNVIKVDDVPGLAVFIEDWLDDLDSPEDFCWPWYRRCTAPGCVPHSGVGCAACGGCGLVVVLPLGVPAARDALVRWFAAGAPHPRPHREPADLSWARDIPGALAKSVRLVLKGKPPLRGALGEWCQPYGSDRAIWQRKSDACRSDECISEVHYLHGWQADQQEGREAGDAGKAAADASVIDEWWLTGGPHGNP